MDTLKFDTTNGCLGIGVHQERFARSFSVADWNEVQIGDHCYRRSSVRISEDILYVESPESKLVESPAIPVVKEFLEQLRADGYDDAADEIEFQEDGTIFDMLTAYVPTGKMNVIATASLSKCKFFFVDRKIVSPAAKLHILFRESQIGNQP